MRVIAGLVAIIALVGLIAIATGFLEIGQTRQASLPDVKVEGGSLPAFDAKVAKIEVGTENRTVEVPKVDVRKPNP